MRLFWLILAIACGGEASSQPLEQACTNPEHLVGLIGVSIENDPSGRLAAWVTGLNDAGYFNGLAGRAPYEMPGSTTFPHLIVAPNGALADRAPEIIIKLDPSYPCGGAQTGGCHTWNCNVATIHLHQVDTFILSHELVETIFHPNVEAPGTEIADACETWDHLAMMYVNGVLVLVASYLDAIGSCWPR